jgi:hypothetical protein
MILAIDPGPEQSAYVLYDNDKRALSRGWNDSSFGKVPNYELLYMVRTKAKHSGAELRLVIEMLASYGMPVGREVFETCVMVGRLTEAWNNERKDEQQAGLLYRSVIKHHLCGSMRAKDGNVRQALIDAWGGKEKAMGNKKQPGPLYGVSGDVWAALAVAVTYADRQEMARAA